MVDEKKHKGKNGELVSNTNHFIQLVTNCHQLKMETIEKIIHCNQFKFETITNCNGFS